jgi:Flp pilus assembly protein TadD
MSRWHLQLGNLNEAELNAKAAEQLDPKALDVRVLRGTIARFQGDLKVAEQYLEPAHEEAPSNLIVKNQLALAWADQSDQAKWSRALELSSAAVRSDPRNPELASTLGWIHLRLENFEDADRLLQQGNLGTNISRDTAYYMARLMAKQGKSKDARQMLDAAINAKGPFAYQDEAELWRKELNRGAE